MPHRSSFLIHAKRLAFSSLGLVGREKEIQALTNVFQAPWEDGTKVVLVSGSSGVGKSALMTNYLKDMAGEAGCYVCSGKQGHIITAQSYEAIGEALCSLISQDDFVEKLQDQVTPTIASLLLEVLPGLSPLFRGMDLSSADMDDSCQEQHRTEQLHLAFQKLFQCICSQAKPVVMAIDDLQWADGDTLSLLNKLASDVSIKGLILVVSYRDDELSSKLSATLEKLRDEKGNSLKHIHLGNLSSKDVNHVVAHLLETDASGTAELSNIICAKTHGNVFYALQAMSSLHQAGHVHFDPVKYKWRWNVDEIRGAIMLSDNVVDMVCSRLKGLSKLTRVGLMIGACIGSQFDGDLVKSILRETGTIETNDVTSFDFEEALSEDLIIAPPRKDASTYRFGHDRIHQAAYGLFESPEKLAEMHCLIGRFLLQDSQTTTPLQAPTIILAAESLNLGSSCFSTRKECDELAQINLVAAERAMKMSAFHQAKSFAEKGLEMLAEEGKWEDHFDLSLSLHVLLARLCVVVGDFTACSQNVDIVLAESRTDKTRLEASVIKVRMLQGQGNLVALVGFGREVIKQFGIVLPGKARFHHVVSEFLVIKRRISKLTEEELLLQAETTDESILGVCDIINSIGLAAYFLDDKNLLCLAHLRLLTLALFRDGPCRYTSVGWFAYSMILVLKGDFSAAYKYGIFTRQMADRFDDKEINAFVYASLYTFLVILRQPLHDVIDPTLKYYGYGIETGNSFFACLNALVYVRTYIHVGLALEPLVNDFPAIRQHFRKKNKTTFGFTLDVYTQFVLCLVGRTKDPFVLSGEFMEEELWVRQGTSQNNHRGVCVLLTNKLMIGYILDPESPVTEAAAHALWHHGTTPVKNTSEYIYYCFYSGMAAMTLERQHGKRKYKNRRKSCIKKIEEWESKGVPWVSHLVALIKAERDWLLGKSREEVKSGFDQAIRLASRTGFVNDGALANERCGRFFLSQDDEGWARFYLDKALSLYREWGATAKVKLLVSAHPFLGFVDDRSALLEQGSSSFKGRERFTSRYGAQRQSSSQIAET